MTKTCGNTIAIVQVRMGSTRLPVKAMLAIEGQPILWWVIRQLKGSKLLDGILIATTLLKADDAIQDFALTENIPCFRGSTDDIVDRIYKTAKEYNVDTVVRITADDIFKDPEQIDSMLSQMEETKADVAVNYQPPSFPYGMDLDIV